MTDNNNNNEERIRVIVRVRPLQIIEQNKGQYSVVKLAKNNNINNKEQELEIQINSTESQVIACNAIFPTITTQLDFFDNSGIINILDSAIDGFRVCIFAFGQTGAGKTYTVAGPDKTICFNNESGLIGRSLEYLFNRLHMIQVNIFIIN